MNKFWKSIKEALINFFKQNAIKFALIKLVKSGGALGFRTWLVKFIVTHLFEEVAEPLIRAGLIQVGYYYNRIDGKILVKKLEEAKRDNDQGAYDRTVDDIFSR